ncbi:hypothetical protein pdam_00018281 [Pocillopora damicornis]|uniref:Uncharacterized protein n=1 Tax=Pocillopora damicornis TaxID=46731 RepID=A0A3M6UAU3_POCDA|nr:hypothetical protein pdam_00018281 [Pocillopora damicornis]
MADRQKQADKELTQPLLSSDEDPYVVLGGIIMAVSSRYQKLPRREDALPVFIGSTGSDDFRGGAEVRFITLENKPVFDKVQSRSGNVAKQRVHDGVIQMEAISPVGQILSIRTWVFREPNAAQLHKDKNGPVELQVTYGQHNIEKQFFSVNLDSVYDGPIAPVYELAKVEMDKRNLFQLIVELSFHNGAGEESQSFYSKPFLIRSRPRNNPSKAKPGMKRPRIVPDSTGEEEEEGEDSPVHFSPDSSVSMTGGSVEFQNLRVIDHLEAKRAHIEHLSFVVSNAGARKADIGYHFKLKDPDLCEDFEEGDVVGFFKGDDGRASIQLLNNKNGKDAVMAGVVSRSAYLEATPSISEDGLVAITLDAIVVSYPTDVVCVIGVIKVKCVGSVRAGERLYASVDLDNPGTAIPESHLPPSVLLGKTSTLLGMAMEEKKASKLDDVHLVQCFVCIVLGVCDKEIASEIESMYYHFEMDLAIRLRRERKKTRRLMCVMGWGFVILLILVAVFMYEYLYPGSALRYWICKQGSIPGHRASFRYIPASQIHQRCDARGIEFTWDGLEQKMSPHLDGIPPLNSTVAETVAEFFNSTESEVFQDKPDVRFVTLEKKDVFDKIESRKGGRARQRVEDGVIQMEAWSPVKILDITSIRVWVMREKQAAELCNDRNGPVSLPVKFEGHKGARQLFSVDLDSKYDGPNPWSPPLYKLEKGDMKKKNVFQLLVELPAQSGETQEFYSKPFLLRSKPKTGQPKKRKSSEDSSSVESSSEGSTPKKVPSSFQNLRVIEHLEAKSAYIGSLKYDNLTVNEGRADIGYHFKVKDPNLYKEFEEGDVLGFFKSDDGTACVQLLDSQNGKQAFMAGVISRSAYLEATPAISQNDPTDVICVIGIIKVKCMGSVRAGERIYTNVSPDHPGTAIPESHLPPCVILGGGSVLLGMSMEEKEASKLNDINLVQSFVCMVLGVSDKEIKSEIGNMYNRFDVEVATKLRKERRKASRMRRMIVCGLLTALALTAFWMYQFLYPGSALRYWICEHGSLGDSKCNFTFIPERDTAQRCTTIGLEFTWDRLKERMKPHLDDIPELDSKRVPGKHHYYLNVDRCAYGGVIKLSAPVSGISNNEQICGPIIFVVNSNCSAVYFYQDKPHAGWKIYQSVKHYEYLRQKLHCTRSEVSRE